MSSVNASEWIAIASAVVAVCALATSIWQGFITRRHARLSAKPIIEAEAHANQDPGIAIVNSGIGPARLMKLTVLFGDQSFNLLTDAGHQKLTEALVADPLDRELVHHYVPRFGSAIAVGQRMPLVEIPAARDNYRLSGQLATTYREMTLHVEYESIYGERMSTTHAFRDTA